MNGSRKRTAGVIAALIALVLLVFLLLRARKPDATATAETAAAAAERDVVARAAAVKAKTPAARQVSTAAEAPIVDEIIVEKPEVCRGEENLITVRAHTPSGDGDVFLHYMIVSDTGASVPLRLQGRRDEQEGAVQRQIVVFGKDNISTTVDLPPYTVKEDCDVPRMLNISRRILANTEASYELTARIRDVSAATPMTPVIYRWSFGDGTTAETSVAWVEHDFADRPQDSLYSQLLITCEVVGEDGETLMGRTSMQLLNTSFEEMSTKGMIRMFTALTPRFPELAADGTVTQKVRVWHSRPDPVKVDGVTVTRHLRGATSQTTPPTPTAIDPTSVLGTTMIPREGITFTVKLDTKKDGEASHLDYLITGTSAEGLPAHGNFSLMRPPDLPTRENSRPVMSGYMKAKILRARELLGKEFVTDEDLWRLEREGKFADLREADFPPAEPEPEPTRPR